MDKFLNIPASKKREKMEMEGEEAEQQESLPWIEKYRPNKLDELSYQEEVTSSLKNILKTGNLPHLLFYGPAGTGKTSAIIALSKELFGPKFYKKRVIELNASDDRGISVVREKVKAFAHGVIVKNSDKNYPCPPFKIAILDEADLMTRDAQSALRRVIEDNSSTTRFCIICNYVTKIIDPVASRCIKFRFKPIPVETQLQKLETICQSEGIQHLNRGDLQVLLEKGDLRQSINSLQSLHKLKVEKVPPILMPTSIDRCRQMLQELLSSSSVKQAFDKSKEFEAEQNPMDEVVNGLITVIVEGRLVRHEKTKAMMLEVVSKAEEGLVCGASETQMIDMLTSLYYVSQMKV